MDASQRNTKRKIGRKRSDCGGNWFDMEVEVPNLRDNRYKESSSKNPHIIITQHIVPKTKKNERFFHRFSISSNNLLVFRFFLLLLLLLYTKKQTHIETFVYYLIVKSCVCSRGLSTQAYTDNMFLFISV